METNDPSIDEYVARACARLSLDSKERLDPWALDEGAILWDGQAGAVWFNGRRISLPADTRDPLETGIRGVGALLAQAFRRLRRQQALYAVGVAKGDACIAVAAASGTGKTTLALELLRRGWSAFGDEFLLLDRETLIVEGVPLALMVREPSLAVLGDKRLERLTQRGNLVSRMGGVRTWHDLDIERAFGRGALAAPRPLTHLVIFERSDNAVSSLESVSPATATLEILPHLFIDSLKVSDMWEAVERFARVECFRARVTDHRSGADLLEKLHS